MTVLAAVLPFALAGALLWLNRRILDNWNLSLRRERALIAIVTADSVDEVWRATDALRAEVDAQADYERRRAWWSRRSPSVGRAW